MENMKINRLSPVRRVVISGNHHQDEYLSEIEELLRQLRDRGIRIAVERRLSDYLRGKGIAIGEGEIVDKLPADADAAISIGGDGTFLRTARWIGARAIPVLGINTGHLGFLANYSPSSTPELVEMLYRGEGVVEERLALKVIIEGECDAPDFSYALNEVAILKEDTASMINVRVEVEGHYLADYLADGLLISTPTGSTGYSLSAGGAVISPTLEVMMVTPIAPHTLTFRPFIVNGDERIELRTTSRAPRYRVSLDGESFLMPVGSKLIVQRADFMPRVIRRLDDSFADTLRLKLLWGMR